MSATWGGEKKIFKGWCDLTCTKIIASDRIQNMLTTLGKLCGICWTLNWSFVLALILNLIAKPKLF